MTGRRYARHFLACYRTCNSVFKKIARSRLEQSGQERTNRQVRHSSFPFQLSPHPGTVALALRTHVSVSATTLLFTLCFTATNVASDTLPLTIHCCGDRELNKNTLEPVSYTHLTLPT